MTQHLPEITYERSMNHNYMVLRNCDFFGKQQNTNSDYRTRMLLENTIPGLLPVTHRLVNGESRYYYEINSLQSLDRVYDKSEISYHGLKKLLAGCISLFDKLEEYLLDGSQLMIVPELIFINVEKMEPYFVCYPDYEGDVRIAFMEFIDGLLTKIDHTDEQAVMLGYQVYRYTRNPNYVISGIGSMIGSVDVISTNVCSCQKNEAASVRRGHGINIYHDKTATDSAETIRNNIWQVQGSFAKDVDTDQCKSGKETGYPEKDLCGAEIKKRDASCSEKVSDEREMACKAHRPFPDKEHRTERELLGGIFCILIGLSGITVLTGTKFLQLRCLSENMELYLYGAVAMAAAAAVLFFVSWHKKRRQKKELEYLDQYTDDRVEETDCDFVSDVHSFSQSRVTSGKLMNKQPDICTASGNILNETVCLGDSGTEERILYGRINGKEAVIPLDKLPMTVGKLESMADFVIEDATVSKMHARFEERAGRVYICDLNSTNGTTRNGTLLELNHPVALEPGDRIRIGRTSFTYC